MAKHQGISSNIVERGVAARVTMMATDQDSDAPSRKAWPISALRDDQSIAHGLIRTTTPARPNPAASQRRGGMRSRRKISDSGTTHIVVVLARIAVRPAATQATASWANAKYSAKLADADRNQRGKIVAMRHAQPPAHRENCARSLHRTSTARPSANHSGVLPRLKAILVSGHALLSRITDTASWMKPAAARFFPSSDEAAVPGIDNSTERDIRNP